GPDFLGTLELAHPEPNTYTQQDLESLQTLAGQAAVAIRHAQVFQDSQERALAQEQLAYIASLAVTSLNLDELLTRIMTKTVEALSATMGAVLLLNRDETELYPHPAGVIGIDPADFETFKLSTASPQFQQSVLLTGRPFWTNNAATDKRILPLYRPFIEQFKVTTALVVPLTTADKNIGEVYLLNKPTPFRNRDVTFLASVAVHFATAIQNATLFQTTQHSLNELSILYKSTADLASTLSVEEVLGNLAERMVSILPADECAIFRVDETAGLLESFVDQPLPGSDPARPIADYPLTARVLKTRQPVVVCADNPQADEAELALLKQQGYNVLLMLPLVARSRAIGLVKLYATQDITYRPEDINLAQAMANQAAMALENAQLYTEADEQLKLRLKELSGLQKVIHELNSTLVFENIIRLVIEEAVRATGADFGNVTLYDSQTKHYKTHVHAGWPPEAVDSIPTITDQMGIMGRVLRQKMPEIVDDVSKDPDYIPFPIPSRSEMVVPIQYADVVEGVINLESTRPAAFTRHQLQYVQALADQAAIAIRNAQAFEEQVKERRDAATRANQLAQLSEINRAFRANRPLEFILEEIAFAIQETVGFNIVLLSVVRHNHLHRITGAGLPIVELNKARQKPQPLEFLSQVMQPDFKMGDSFFIPAERRDIWQGKIDVVFSEIAAAGAATPPDHIWQTEDLLFTPLKDAEGTIIGLLSVDAPRNGLRPTPQVVTVLELFANQAATAIENTNLFRELERQATHLKLSGQISARISGILKPAELMGEVVNLIANAFNYYYVQIYQPDARQPTLLLAKDGAGAAGVNHKILDPNRRLPIDERSIAGWVAAHRRPLIVNDVEQDSRYMPVEHLPETRSELAVPITAGQILVGVLDIQHNQPHAFSKDSLDNMQTLAGQLSVAVQNAQLFDEALQRERLSSALGHTGLIFNATLDPNAIFDVICREAISAFQVDGAFLWLVENGQARGVAAAGSKSGAFIGKTISLTDTRVLGIRIIQEKRAEYINGVDFADEAMDHSLIKEFNVRSVMGAPLIVGDQTLGALIMIDSHNPNRFDIQDQISVTLLANQAAIAIQNAQLVDRLNRFAEELEQRVDVRTDQLRQERDRVDTLYKIARGLSSSLDLDRVLNEALSLINQTINITRGAILLVDDATGSLHYRAAYGRKPPLPKGGKSTPYRMGVGLAGRVLETREPINVANLADNEDWISDGKPSPHRSVLAVPLITGFEIVGVLMLYHAETGYFTADHMRLVTAAAPIIATAINNAGLYKLISEQVERLGVLLGTVRAEARKNEAIVEGIADGVLVLDDDLAIQLVNPAAANILGMQREFLQGQRLSMIPARNPVTIEEKLVYELCRYITNPQPELQGEEERGPHRIEVDPKVVLVILSSVTLSPNAPASTLVVLRDISREAELERIKNEFISTVSHELRTPMTSIKGYTDLLASDKVGPLTAIQMKFVQVIKNNADRLTALVNDILDISRIDTGRVKLDLQYIDLTPLLGEVVASFSHQLEEKNLSVTVRIPEQLPPVFADYNRATQIMVNLVGNAVKYTRPGDSITVSANLNPREVQINVQDSGLGIAPEDKERVFNRFFRSERDVTSLVGGTGLGLPIAKMFVEMMGGEIWLESELGAGTTFSFTLPLQDQRIEESRVVESLAGRRRILVVDDNTDIVDVLKRQLEVEGYNVVTTLNGSQVLELAKQHHPSLITLDIMLDDIDGFEVLAQLKADPETKDIPVVIASVLNDAARRGMALGAADYLVKP
ncbi:MAG: GAF domain-containing protein, partial [Anaerolineae bacterium]